VSYEPRPVLQDNTNSILYWSQTGLGIRPKSQTTSLTFTYLPSVYLPPGDGNNYAVSWYPASYDVILSRYSLSSTNGVVTTTIRLDCDSITVRLPFDCKLRYDHSTTFVTTLGTAV